MDTTAKDIVFDEQGFCNFCTDYLRAHKSFTPNLESREYLFKTIKREGRGKKYDCIVGVSGGVDSSYALYLAVKNGLRPLAVHLDNGWNSELAVSNISNLVKALHVDLHTHVIDWPENRALQLAFMRADVVDIEMLMDNAMLRLNFDMAAKHGVKHILAGTNVTTEGLAMPHGWNYNKFDKKNITNIYRKFGDRDIPIRTHRLMSVLRFFSYRLAGIKWISFLDHFDYVKSDVLQLLEKEVGYRRYPYKHYESVFTRFYQAYILPRKFGIDKRKVHLSNLIVSGQASRDEALKDLEKSPYADPDQELADLKFVTKKLGFTQESFKEYLSRPAANHESYGSELWKWRLVTKVLEIFRGGKTTEP